MYLAVQSHCMRALYQMVGSNPWTHSQPLSVSTHLLFLSILKNPSEVPELLVQAQLRPTLANKAGVVNIVIAQE